MFLGHAARALENARPDEAPDAYFQAIDAAFKSTGVAIGAFLKTNDPVKHEQADSIP
jgi:hypothetical protein